MAATTVRSVACDIVTCKGQWKDKLPEYDPQTSPEQPAGVAGSDSAGC